MSELWHCDFCDRSFDKRRGLVTHCIRVHAEEMEEAKRQAIEEETEEFQEMRARKLSRQFTGDEDSWPAFYGADVS